MILEFILLLVALAVFNWLYNRWRQLQNEKIDLKTRIANFNFYATAERISTNPVLGLSLFAGTYFMSIFFVALILAVPHYGPGAITLVPLYAMMLMPLVSPLLFMWMVGFSVIGIIASVFKIRSVFWIFYFLFVAAIIPLLTNFAR